ncbi:sugar ABC transporter ATP-binding protein [Halioxenophilus sp. WMMB6]|uniref:sugar ABC transporter ATP-binding protein n=1 Tax=Halioxenophilus sp. WMMB6 TaxID=3073815 RepID=UPI00295E68FA|nr:sugar ABC transporter ATP-binding protein [Halioxenophilus sp. WMMB6]
MESNSPPLLRIIDLHKSFNVPVLTGIDIDIHAGEVHALMGANGAGKSTLCNIVAGFLPASAGQLLLAGEPYAPESVNAAEQEGVRLVMQELNLIGNLSVAENISLRNLPNRFGFIKKSVLHRQAEQALALVGLQAIDPDTPLNQLGVGQQQLVEIAATITKPCRLLILDEPTAALTDPQIDRLFEQLKQLKAAGTAIIYISHRMAEIQRIADRITVMRDGKSVATTDAHATSVAEIVQHMTGETQGRHADYTRRVTGPLALRVVGLSRAPLLQAIDLAIYRGEILGIAGLIGSGRTELLRALFGADGARAGDEGYLQLGEAGPRLVFTSPSEAIAAGLGLIPEDRKQQGLLLSDSIAGNISLANLGAVSNRWGWLQTSREERAAESYRQQLAIKCKAVSQPVAQLSGGNQQKVVISRWLFRDREILLFDEPTRGIDMHTKQRIYQLLHELALQGKAIVMVSSETSELTTLCDRIAVISNGAISALFERGEWTPEKLLAAAFKGYSERPSAAELN